MGDEEDVEEHSVEVLLEHLRRHGSEGGDLRYHRNIRVWRQKKDDPEPTKKMISQPALPKGLGDDLDPEMKDWKKRVAMWGKVLPGKKLPDELTPSDKWMHETVGQRREKYFNLNVKAEPFNTHNSQI